MLDKGPEVPRGGHWWETAARIIGEGAGEEILCLEAGDRPSQAPGIRTWTSWPGEGRHTVFIVTIPHLHLVCFLLFHAASQEKTWSVKGSLARWQQNENEGLPGCGSTHH